VPVCSPQQVGLAEHKEMGIARQRLHKYIPVAMNTDETIKEVLDVKFSMQSMPYQMHNI
jgi:hypothetical protein